MRQPLISLPTGDKYCPLFFSRHSRGSASLRSQTYDNTHFLLTVKNHLQWRHATFQSRRNHDVLLPNSKTKWSVLLPPRHAYQNPDTPPWGQVRVRYQACIKCTIHTLERDEPLHTSSTVNCLSSFSFIHDNFQFRSPCS